MEPISTSHSVPQREGSPMRLTDHLQEQQEPFELEAYLLERGCTGKSFYSEGNVGCFFSSSHLSRSKFLRRSATTSFSICRRKRKKNVSAANKSSQIRTALCKKLVSIDEVIRLKHHYIGDGKFDDTIQGRRNRKAAVSIEVSGKLSSVTSSSSEFSFQSEIHVDDTSTSMDGSKSQIQPSHRRNQSATERMIQWRIKEKKKQCSPDSVLDEVEASPIHKVGSSRQEEQPSTSIFNLPKKPTEDSIFSTSFCDLIVRREKQSVFGSKDTSSRYTSSKKALQQTGQLLFDCVREAVESRGRQRKTGHLMGPEKPGKIICDKMKVWNRKSANGKKITRLLRSDLLSSFEEWDGLEDHRGDIVKEVGDQLLEQMKDEMVEDMINFYIYKSHKHDEESH